MPLLASAIIAGYDRDWKECQRGRRHCGSCGRRAPAFATAMQGSYPASRRNPWSPNAPIVTPTFPPTRRGSFPPSMITPPGRGWRCYTTTAVNGLPRAACKLPSTPLLSALCYVPDHKSPSQPSYVTYGGEPMATLALYRRRRTWHTRGS